MTLLVRWLRDVRLIGAVVLTGLLCLAWCYYLERTACFDSAWFSWLMIDSGMPTSALGRYASWTAQLLPVWLVHQEAPLSTVLLAYSICLMLVHVAIFLVIACGLRDERGAVALPITLVTGLHLMFYYGVSELNQGLSFTVLVWYLLRRTRKEEDRWWAWALALVVLNAWTSFHHPVLLLPLMFIIGLEALRGAPWPQRRWWWLSAACVGWYAVRISLFTGSSYEQERMPGLADVLGNLGNLSELPSTRYLLSVWTKFKAFLLLLPITLLLLLRSRGWATLAWLVLWMAGTLLLILITDRNQGSPVLFENFYPLLALAVAVTFADKLADLQGRERRIGMVAFGGIAMLGLVQVERAHHPFTMKVEHAQHLTQQLHSDGVRKAIASNATLPWAVVWSHWAFAFETALISGIDGPTAATTVFVDNDITRYEQPMRATGALLGPTWEPVWFGSQNLRKRYFDLPDSGYTVIAHAAAADAARPTRGSMELLGPEGVVVLPPSPVGYVTIRLRDLSGRGLQALDARGAATMLRTRVLPDAGDGIPVCDDRTPLERDLLPGHELMQGLIIGRPRTSGRYRVEVELEVAGRPTGIRTSFVAEARRFGL